MLIAAGLKLVETAPFYIFSTFVVSYATTTLSYQKSQALESVTLGALVATVVGFIGPEYLYNDRQIIRAGLEDHFMGKLSAPDPD